MTFKDAFNTCLREKYAVVSGRASRSEFWYFVLFMFLASLAASVVDMILFSGMISYGMGPVSAIVTLILLIPSITVSVRRLHDRNMTGWWLLLVIIPGLGTLILLIFMILKGTEGDNKYGPAPV